METKGFDSSIVNLTCDFFCFPGLKGGGPSVGNSGGANGTSFSYTFHGDPHAMFAEFFGGRNPFDTFFGGQRNGEEGMDIDDPFSAFPMGMGGFTNVNFGRSRPAQEPSRKKQDPPVTHDLRVSLEEIYSGCTKKMKISHKRLNPDGKSIRNEDKILTIEVKRGWKEGTKITFPKEGDQTSNNIPADIVFVLKDKPHNIFKRDGSDVIYPARISLREVRYQVGGIVRGDCCGEQWGGWLRLFCANSVGRCGVGAQLHRSGGLEGSSIPFDTVLLRP